MGDGGRGEGGWRGGGQFGLQLIGVYDDVKEVFLLEWGVDATKSEHW